MKRVMRERRLGSAGFDRFHELLTLPSCDLGEKSQAEANVVRELAVWRLLMNTFDLERMVLVYINRRANVIPGV